MLFAFLSVVIGVSLSVQTAVNSRLRSAVGSPFFATFASFFIGTAVLGALAAIHGGGTLVPPGAPWWAYLGGALGVIFLTSNILLFRPLGAVETMLLPVLGQIAMSLAIDHFGWFGSPRIPLGLIRILGALLVLAGVSLAVIMRAHSPALSRHRTSNWHWRVLGVVAGGLSAIQSAINGHLGSLLGSPLNAAFVSFSTGTLVLFIIVAAGRQWPTRARLAAAADALEESRRASAVAEVLDDASPEAAAESAYPAQPHLAHPWWMWIGGLLGAAYVFTIALVVPQIGTGLALMFAMLGQIAGSLAIDHYGILEARRNPIVPIQFLGILVMAVGVTLIRLVS